MKFQDIRNENDFIRYCYEQHKPLPSVLGSWAPGCALCPVKIYNMPFECFRSFLTGHPIHPQETTQRIIKHIRKAKLEKLLK